MAMRINADVVIAEIIAEAERCEWQYGDPTSTHESLGVLLEEFNELQAAIQSNDIKAIKREAVQVASAAYRLASACDDPTQAFFDRSGFKKGSVPCL